MPIASLRFLLMRHLSPLDRWLSAADAGLRTVCAPPSGCTASPADEGAPPAAHDTCLLPEERALSGALMRVNHVGEVCAQALYQSQALVTSNAALRAHFLHAAEEEMDHLAWTHARIQDLGTHVSWLNPLWYGGAFALGCLMGMQGDARSLGFVVETERQVEAHLQSHLDRLPENDAASRRVVSRMEADERRHADEALKAGGAPLAFPLPALMRMAARIMTSVAHRL